MTDMGDAMAPIAVMLVGSVVTIRCLRWVLSWVGLG